MKTKKLIAALAFGLVTSSAAYADQETIIAFNNAGIVLTEEQGALLLAASCTDEASCNQLTELVSDIAASLDSDAAIEAMIVAFRQAHPELAQATINSTIAKNPSAALALAEVTIETAPAAAGPVGAASPNNRANNRTLATPAASVVGGATASVN